MYAHTGTFVVVIIMCYLNPADYDVIFGHLEGVRGTVELREAFVAEIVKEAKKFKKWKLVELLEDWSNSLKTTVSKTDSNKPPLKLKHSQKRT